MAPEASPGGPSAIPHVLCWGLRRLHNACLRITCALAARALTLVGVPLAPPSRAEQVIALLWPAVLQAVKGGPGRDGPWALPVCRLCGLLGSSLWTQNLRPLPSREEQAVHGQNCLSSKPCFESLKQGGDLGKSRQKHKAVFLVLFPLQARGTQHGLRWVLSWGRPPHLLRGGGGFGLS